MKRISPVLCLCVLPVLAIAGDDRLSAGLRQTLAAMEDGGGSVGEMVVNEIRDRRIAVIFQRQEPASTYEVARDKTVAIYLSDALPPEPRILAPLIAREIGLLTVSSMIESAESHYMWHSLMARAWRELGGEPRTLPIIDEDSGYKNEAMAGEIALWLRARYDLSAVSRFHGVRTIAELKGEIAGKISAGDDVFRNQMILYWLERDEEVFRSFLQKEREWILSR
ncbi:MAG: hypothetical protein HY921_08485 [Elusimicrobia bacterium]|nr:hypothetical protein [Elusimicrobiota bacterium]